MIELKVNKEFDYFHKGTTDVKKDVTKKMFLDFVVRILSIDDYDGYNPLCFTVVPHVKGQCKEQFLSFHLVSRSAFLPH